MEKLTVVVTRIDDGYNCETCGGNFASGWRIDCQAKPEINLDLTPFAHCYDSTDYDGIESIFRAWIANGIKIPNVELTEEQLGEYDLMQFLMPDMYITTKQSYVNYDGETVEYDEVLSKINELDLLGEYLFRIYGVPVELVHEYEDNSTYDEWDDDE